jgi:hypothetical protein
MEQQIFLSSRSKKEYPVYLTEEELNAIPILVDMAMVYSWELYNKKENDKFYKKHKEIIDKIAEYHKTNQGVLAVGSFIESKANQAQKNIELDKILTPYMSKEILEEAVLYFNKQIKINNHVGIFEDSYVDFITIIYDDDKTYDAIPIENKFTIPYVESGMVNVVYRKKVKNVVRYTSNNKKESGYER